MSNNPTISLSIVSHGQGGLIANLLHDLLSFEMSDVEIVLTINIPEPLDFLVPYSNLRLQVIENTVPLGFGANHNQAFQSSRGRFFCVVNPDIRLPNDSFKALPQFFDKRTGACAPLVTASDGEIQDSARRFPTFGRLFARAILRQREPDYLFERKPVSVDWLAGMFIAFRREAFEDVAGFNDRYFMYMEDADLGRRLRRRGWEVHLIPTIQVIHDAQRASRRDLRHLRWHLRSVIRYLVGI